MRVKLREAYKRSLRWWRSHLMVVSKDISPRLPEFTPTYFHQGYPFLLQTRLQ